MTKDAEYNLAAIRELLLAAFTAEELHRFCLDRPVFQPIVTEFGPGQGLDDMVDRVIEYCRTRILWEELLGEVKGIRPRQHALFVPQLRDSTHPPAPQAERPIGSERGDRESPMDLSALASTVITSLSLYLADAGDPSQAAGASRQKAAEIHQAIKDRFLEEKDDYFSRTLERFEEMPERRKGAMQKVLEEVLETDPRFAQSLNSLLQEAHEAGAEIIRQQVVVSDQARTGDITQIGKIQGSVDLRRKR